MEIAAETNRFLESALPAPLLPTSQSALLRWGDRAQGAVREQEGPRPGSCLRPAPAGGTVACPWFWFWFWLLSVAGAGLGDKESPLPEAWQPLQGGRAPGTPRTTAPHAPHSDSAPVWGPETKPSLACPTTFLGAHSHLPLPPLRISVFLP